MSAGNEEARRRLRAELRGWGLDPVRFQDQDLDMLLQGGYHNCQDLEVATYEHLRSLGLAPARVDAIVAAQCKRNTDWHGRRMTATALRVVAAAAALVAAGALTSFAQSLHRGVRLLEAVLVHRDPTMKPVSRKGARGAGGAKQVGQ